MTAVSAPTPVRRVRLEDARTDRLFFAQVHEDPRLELEALERATDGTIVVVGSGGCTALSILASGARHVAAVDLNVAQNHLIELKLAAVCGLAGEHQAIGFLGGAPADPRSRLATYQELRPSLSHEARTYWDRRGRALAAGVISAGVSERLVGVLRWAIRRLVHPAERVERLLACESVSQQRALFDREWNTRRWRLLFTLLLGRRALSRTYDPAFFQYVENPSFAAYFRRRFEETVSTLPVRDNYFLHHALAGRYPTDQAGGVPPYLAPGAGHAMAERRDGLTLVDGSLTTYLKRCPDRSIAGFSLSNICEWLTPEETGALLAEIVRTARAGATLCFRNFVGWTEVPPAWRRAVVEDRARGEALHVLDRSLVVRRFAVCRIERTDG